MHFMFRFVGLLISTIDLEMFVFGLLCHCIPVWVLIYWHIWGSIVTDVSSHCHWCRDVLPVLHMFRLPRATQSSYKQLLADGEMKLPLKESAVDFLLPLDTCQVSSSLVRVPVKYIFLSSWFRLHKFVTKQVCVILVKYGIQFFRSSDFRMTSFLMERRFLICLLHCNIGAIFPSLMVA